MGPSAPLIVSLFVVICVSSWSFCVFFFHSVVYRVLFQLFSVSFLFLPYLVVVVLSLIVVFESLCSLLNYLCDLFFVCLWSFDSVFYPVFL